MKRNKTQKVEQYPHQVGLRLTPELFQQIERRRPSSLPFATYVRYLVERALLDDPASQRVLARTGSD